jgi:hypothetical protein
VNSAREFDSIRPVQLDGRYRRVRNVGNFVLAGLHVDWLATLRWLGTESRLSSKEPRSLYMYRFQPGSATESAASFHIYNHVYM